MITGLLPFMYHSLFYNSFALINIVHFNDILKINVLKCEPISMWENAIKYKKCIIIFYNIVPIFI